jgi:GH35 family endo-1,4-beta-xylanase
MGERRMATCMMGLALLAACAMNAGCAGTWKRTADAGIERYRKRDAQVTVVRADGTAAAGEELILRQTRKGFPFGAAISRGLLRNERWQEEVKKHFNWAVFENETKWYANEGAQGRVTYRDADALLGWCEANGIKVRGHCVFWEVEQWEPKWLLALAPDALRAAVEKRLDVVTHFKGRVASWDVDNEMLHGNFFASRLGKEVLPWMYQRVHELDPQARLFTNDFNILTVDQNFSETQTAAYVEQIRALIKGGAPIGGIGVQGHFWKEDVLKHPEVIRKRLDMLATLGLPIWISEFDVADADPQVRADKLEVAYRTAYSHPAVQGIVMWVFWAGNSWRGPTAALFDQDWTINAEGRRYEALMAEWTTTAEVKTDRRGTCTFRGFHGSYEVVRARDGAVVGRFELEPGARRQEVRIVEQ